MDIETPLKYREAYRAYGVLKRKGSTILLRDLDQLSPKETAKIDYVKQLGVTAEEIAKAAGRSNGKE
jgi:DNA-directed RNA polymerase specialized sigma24 family protein